MFKFLISKAFAAADDYISPPATVEVNQGASNILTGLLGVSTKFRNLIGSLFLPYNDSVCGEKKIPIIYCRTTPVGDANYASMPIGSIAIQTAITSEAVTAMTIFVKQGALAADWYRVPMAGAITGTTAATAAGGLPITVDGTEYYIQLYSAVS